MRAVSAAVGAVPSLSRLFTVSGICWYEEGFASPQQKKGPEGPLSASLQVYRLVDGYGLLPVDDGRIQSSR